ncbi:MAG TPA: zinc-binding dehydrogenase [Acidimicrobiales bacterium]|nr:zinc-binding dehydrogenase [Acidimicrobiales bacterium]
MKAVVFSDGAVSWAERPDPEPGPHDLLVRVAAAGLNGADILQKGGRYPPPRGVPADQPGLECAGTVEATGRAVESYKPGDQVMGLLAGTGQAELALLDERVAMPVPEACSLAEGGGFPEVFSTAYDALFPQAGLSMGERVLVTGAAGGVGTAAVQLAVACGASVVASVRDPQLHERVASLGATAAAPDEAPDHGPYDVVLELVGGPNLPDDLASLAPQGRVIVIGIGAGSKTTVDLAALMHARATVRGSTLRSRAPEEKALLARQLERHVLPSLGLGRIKVVTTATYPFAAAEEAYDRFEKGHKFGKIILTSS